MVIVSLGCAAEVTEPARTVIGAIRWDAWIGNASPVGLAVEKSLSPAQWHYRLPFYAKEEAPDKVEVRGNSQQIMDREIEYAVAGGLDYWAFVIYPPDDPMTTGGLDLYLTSHRKKDLNFCALIEGKHLGAEAQNWRACQDRLTRYFQEPTYQRVCGDRPLMFILQSGDMVPNGFGTVDAARSAVGLLREEARKRGLGNPFIVAMEWSPSAGKVALDQFGLDAVSKYCSNGSSNGASYADLTAYTAKSWDDYAREDHQIVPWVTTGLDRRPRVENPVFWEKPHTGEKGGYYERLNSLELTRHFRDAIRWNATHPGEAKANAVIAYAWNEFDEGGWLCPTLSEGDERLRALRAALFRK